MKPMRVKAFVAVNIIVISLIYYFDRSTTHFVDYDHNIHNITIVYRLDIIQHATVSTAAIELT